MTARPLTLMAVHAHPDDEASSTGGTLAKYSAQGVRTVLVTCTNGALGDGSEGSKPGDGRHDEAAVVALRRSELERSCEILGVSHLELLDYQDSGMMGWPSNEAPGAFWGMPVDVAAAPLTALMDRYQPHVVVTYDDFGFYGHPDHIQAHRITLAALDASGVQAKLYCPTIRRSRLPLFRERMLEAGLDPPEFDESRFGSLDEDIAATIDCLEYAATKIAALAAHGSQQENIFFLRLPPTVFNEMFATEEFLRLRGPADRKTPESDLFEGVRDGRGDETPGRQSMQNGDPNLP